MVLAAGDFYQSAAVVELEVLTLQSMILPASLEESVFRGFINTPVS